MYKRNTAQLVDKIVRVCRQTEGSWDWETSTTPATFKTDTILLKCRRCTPTVKHGLVTHLPLEWLVDIAHDPAAIQQIAHQMAAQAKPVSEGSSYPEAVIQSRRVYTLTSP